MPAKDFYHNNVKNALIADEWTITNDPLKLKYGLRYLYVDLGAMKLLAAEKEERKIAVEVKRPIGKLLLKSGRVKLIVFDERQEVIIQWIPEV